MKSEQHTHTNTHKIHRYLYRSLNTWSDSQVSSTIELAAQIAILHNGNELPRGRGREEGRKGRDCSRTGLLVTPPHNPLAYGTVFFIMCLSLKLIWLLEAATVVSFDGYK